MTERLKDSALGVAPAAPADQAYEALELPPVVPLELVGFFSILILLTRFWDSIFHFRPNPLHRLPKEFNFLIELVNNNLKMFFIDMKNQEGVVEDVDDLAIPFKEQTLVIFFFYFKTSLNLKCIFT